MRSLSILLFIAWIFTGVEDVLGENFQTGFVAENPESYQKFPIRQTYRNFLPVSKDLSDFFPPAGRQGAQSSCVGWALAYSARSYYARRESGLGQKTPEPFSPSFIYNQTKEGDCSSGSSISSGLILLETVGVIGLSEFPYEPKDCSRQPTQAQLNQAVMHRIKSWARVDIAQVDALKAEIYQGNPIVIGMWVTPGFYQMKKGIYSDLSDDSSGGHAMVIVGYDDQRHAFKVINSWGEGWGEKGFGWVSYETMTKRIQNAFVMTPDEGQKPALLTEMRPQSENARVPETGKPLPQGWVETLEKSLPCVSVQTIQGPQGPSNQFTVGDSATAKQLSDWLKGLQTLESSKANIEVRPWPQCEAIQTLKPLVAKDSGFSILINGQRELSLKEGDSLVLSVHRPVPKRYLGVFYLQADGTVVSLTLPADAQGAESIQEEVVIGRPPQTLNVGKPLGEEMVIAISSDQPILGGAGADGRQPDRTFLTRLRGELLAEQSFHSEQPPIQVAYAILHTY